MIGPFHIRTYIYKAIQWVSLLSVHTQEMVTYSLSSTAPSACGTVVSVASFGLDSNLSSSSLTCGFSIVSASFSVDLEH